MPIHLFISVLQCGGVCTGAGLWGSFLLQDKTSMWGQGSPSLGDLKQSHNIWVEGSASFRARAKEQEQLRFIPAIPQVSWLVCVQYNHSWEILCGPSCCSRLGELTDFTVLLYSQGIFVLLTLFLWRTCQAHNPVWHRRGVSVVLLYSRLVGCSPMGAGPILCRVRPAGKQEWKVYGVTLFPPAVLLGAWNFRKDRDFNMIEDLDCLNHLHMIGMCPFLSLSPTSPLPCAQFPLSQGWRCWWWSIKAVVPLRDDLCYQTPSRQNQGLLHHGRDTLENRPFTFWQIWRRDVTVDSSSVGIALGAAL